MKKFAIFTLTLALGAAMLVGCGCMNTGKNVPTLPTNGEATTPTTHAATVPATTHDTEAATEAPTHVPTDTTGTLEGAMDDIVSGPTDHTSAATENTEMNRSRSRGNDPLMG